MTIEVGVQIPCSPVPPAGSYTACQSFPSGIKLQGPPVEGDLITLSGLPLAVSIPTSVSYSHLPNKPLKLESLSQCQLLEGPEEYTCVLGTDMLAQTIR